MNTDQQDHFDEHGAFSGLPRRRRIAAGLTQEQWAERAGLSVRTIRAAERGATTRPYRHSVGELADALGLAGAGLAKFTTAGRPASRHLPAATAGFTGRSAELSTLTGLLESGSRPGTMVISALGGTLGLYTDLEAGEAGQVRARLAGLGEAG